MQMNSVYRKALTGKLPSPPDAAALLPGDVTIRNRLPIPVTVYTVVDGRWGFAADLRTPAPDRPGLAVQSNAETCVRPIRDSYLLFENSLSGGFAAVVLVTSETREVNVTGWLLLEPCNVGPIPVPNIDEGVIIPDDSPPVVVGCGSLPKFADVTEPPNVVVREQFWQSLPESYTIAPGETKGYSFEVVSGLQSTTTEQKTLEESVGVSVGAGWGPVSASISTSLNASSTTFQQVSISEETRSYVSEKRELPQSPADHKYPMMVMYWQLVDRVTVYDSRKVAQPDLFQQSAVGSIFASTQPTVVHATELKLDESTP
ncbi:hypothetical protein ACLIYP_08750 [Streptomyces nanhaiensis]|uniref:hypothetical protein n=1 Tax=Streptomyces nanhaiensis TaxID=679319 RepID=UPI00399D2894